MKIGIVGAGIAGLCTAWALARRGHQIAVFDQGPIPNPTASSHDEHRIIRHAYGSMRGYALMMPEAFAAWRRMWNDLGRTHFTETPATYCLRLESDWYAHVSACLDTMHIPYRTIPPDEVGRTLPMVNPTDLIRVVETKGAGLLHADRILGDLASHLAQSNVALHPHTKITRIDPERATLDTWSGDAIVIATGAWTTKLLGPQPEILRPTAQTIAYLTPPPHLRAAWQSAPMLLNRLPTASGGIYILPPRNFTRLKIGDYTHGEETDPDAPRTPTQSQTDRLLESAHLALANFESYTVQEIRSCRYTVTPDETFAIRPLTAGAWLANACSGHGFKFGALIGEATADGVTGARPAEEVTNWMRGRGG